MRSTLKPWIFLGLLVGLLLSACGFHLQGDMSLPERFKRTYVTGVSEKDSFTKNLMKQLERSGARLSDRGSATAVVNLSQSEGRRVLSVSSDGEVNEYELFLKVTVEVYAPDEEKTLLKEQSLVLTRDVLFDEVAVLGNQSEQALLVEEMKKDMVRLVMYRLRSVRS